MLRADGHWKQPGLLHSQGWAGLATNLRLLISCRGLGEGGVGNSQGPAGDRVVQAGCETFDQTNSILNYNTRSAVPAEPNLANQPAIRTTPTGASTQHRPRFRPRRLAAPGSGRCRLIRAPAGQPAMMDSPRPRRAA